MTEEDRYYTLYIDRLMSWENPHRAGLLPQFLSVRDTRSAREQLHTAYAHGGGFQPFSGFLLEKDGPRYALAYPGDPPMREVARAQLRDELIVLFQGAWVAVIQPDETFEVARMD